MMRRAREKREKRREEKRREEREKEREREREQKKCEEEHRGTETRLQDCVHDWTMKKDSPRATRERMVILNLMGTHHRGTHPLLEKYTSTTNSEQVSDNIDTYAFSGERKSDSHDRRDGRTEYTNCVDREGEREGGERGER
jgi:hypothetical protein